MSDPYHWSFPQRSETMFMATIDQSSPSRALQRQSTFLQHDIPGSQNRRQIPLDVSKSNYALSAYIEPKPQSHLHLKGLKESFNLKTRDIEKAYPQSVEFQTNRVINPLVPRYKLPTSPPLEPMEPAKFLRNTLDVSDIVHKQHPTQNHPSRNQHIEGSSPSKLFKSIEAVSRLQVKDINVDGIFRSSRLQKPIDPLEPKYSWRDDHTDKEKINLEYGNLDNRSKSNIAKVVNRQNDLNLNLNDIYGAKANSSNQMRYFFENRKQYRDIMNTKDIDRSYASSLKKGITTKRQINPLMPKYDYPK